MSLLSKIQALLKPKPVHLQRGMKAEKISRQYLRQQGLLFIQANYHSRWGEIDLIMQEQTEQSNHLLFIEVRYRYDNQQGQAVQSINYKKQQRIKKTAQTYLKHHPLTLGQHCRFDVVLVGGVLKKVDNTEIQWIKNAFDVTSNNW